jgi:hypothetical protein
MKTAGCGAIVNISSMQAFFGLENQVSLQYFQKLM